VEVRTKEVVVQRGVQRGAAAEARLTEYASLADEYVRLLGVSMDKLHTAVRDAESRAHRYALPSFLKGKKNCLIMAVRDAERTAMSVDAERHY
jgi:hypothetical protein